METNQPLISSSSSSSSGDNNPHPDPNDSVTSVHQSATDEVSFGFTHLQIDNNDDSTSKKPMPEYSETDEEDEDDDDDDEDDDDDDGDFTFSCVNEKISDSTTSDVFEDGQIRKVFPLFDQSLLSGGDYEDGKRRLPIEVPVDKVFIESPRRSPSDNGTIRALSTESESQEMNMKSNSTGFSKLWRFRNEMNRSNSDGRDAFVFLETPATTSGSKPNAVGGLTAKVNVDGGKGKGVKKGSKVKKSTASAHEVYLKQKGGQTEEERRRSYLPYRQGLMGFFTNVNGGLSKNVHPF